MSPHPKQSDDNENNVDTFDWKEIRALCLAPEPKHPAYGMQISEYRKRRRDVIDDENNQKSKLGIRVPNTIADILHRIARNYHISVYRYLVLSLELGLITFQKDYHDRCSAINAIGDQLYHRVSSNADMKTFSQLNKQIISLNLSRQDSRLFIPTVPEWVAMAVKSTALELNCTGMNLAYLCLCISIRKSAEEYKIPQPYLDDIDATIKSFDFEIEMLEKRIVELQQYIK